MAEGMLSLAHKIWANNGLKFDDRVAFYWMAKAVERRLMILATSTGKYLRRKVT